MVALIWAKISSQEDERGSKSNDIPLIGTDSYAYIELCVGLGLELVRCLDRDE